MDCAKRTGSIVAAWLALGTGVALAQPAPVTPAPPPPATPVALSAAVETCETSPLPVGRVASFVGSMPATTGATQMQMRFDLQRRHPGERHWRIVRGAQGFGVWATADPGRAGFVFHKRVDSLPAPAAYRAVVRFRWNAADGTIVRRARRTTSACDQPDLRPDLVPGSLRAVLDAQPALAVYTFVVRNSGRSAAGPFSVRVAGAVAGVPGLAAGGQASVVVVGAACAPGSMVDALVDSDHRVDETDERNALRRRCPLAS
ncbi:MAG TPA: CARDB domain-containing protein [Solirubrobacteraceae bacterium]|jgi:CARDB